MLKEEEGKNKNKKSLLMQPQITKEEAEITFFPDGTKSKQVLINL